MCLLFLQTGASQCISHSDMLLVVEHVVAELQPLHTLLSKVKPGLLVGSPLIDAMRLTQHIVLSKAKAEGHCIFAAGVTILPVAEVCMSVRDLTSNTAYNLQKWHWTGNSVVQEMRTTSPDVARDTGSQNRGAQSETLWRKRKDRTRLAGSNPMSALDLLMPQVMSHLQL